MLYQDVQVWVVPVLEQRVEEGVGRILTSSLRRDCAKPALEAVAVFQVLEILDLGISNSFSSLEQGVGSFVSTVPTV